MAIHTNEETSIAAHIDSSCGPSGLYAGRAFILACCNYLNSLGDSYGCAISPIAATAFCEVGEGVVRGWSVTRQHEGNHCKDVAKNVGSVLEFCTDPYSKLTGSVTGSVASRACCST